MSAAVGFGVLPADVALVGVAAVEGEGRLVHIEAVNEVAQTGELSMAVTVI